MSWTSLGNLVVLLAICMQWTLLWTAFWNSCFLGFNTTYTLTIADLIQCSQCTLCLLLVTTDFLGKIHHSQLVYLSLLLSIGFSLNASIFAYGLKIYDSGAGMQVFLFSSVFFIVAWVCAMLRKKLEVTKQVFWYHGQSIGVVGVLLVVYSWGSWNMAGAVFTAKNSVEGLTQLQTSAFMNTIFGMASSIVFSMLLMTPHYKAPITYNIDAIINVNVCRNLGRHNNFVTNRPATQPSHPDNPIRFRLNLHNRHPQILLRQNLHHLFLSTPPPRRLRDSRLHLRLDCHCCTVRPDAHPC